MRGPLPHPPAAFARRKRRILAQLAVPEGEYADASPKGSVDAGIRGLIDALNALDGFVTTSSCAGRVSVFVEGSKQQQQQGTTTTTTTEEEEGRGDVEGGVVEEEEVAEQLGVGGGREAAAATVAGVGGKGGGGTWLFVSHDPVAAGETDLLDVFGLKGGKYQEETSAVDASHGEAESRLIHFKFEPMILHVLTASLEHAQLLLRCGLTAGFRESGAINVTAAAAAGEDAVTTPIVAIRTMGLALESLVGVQRGSGDIECTVSPAYLRTLLDISNERFAENAKRIRRFETAVAEAMQPPRKSDGSEWEDAAARRERKRAEGLRRKAELEERAAREKEAAEDQDAEEALDLPLNTDLAS